MKLKSINPATLETIFEVEELTNVELETKLRVADNAFNYWRNTTFAERSVLMKAAAFNLRAERDKLAKLITSEVGKTIAAATMEVDKCASVCDYYSDNATKFLEPQNIPTDAKESYICFEPLGVVLAVMPWNFPFWQVFRFAAPAIMAGNVGVLKHASNVQGSAFAIEKIFASAGFPEGVFTNLSISSGKVEGIIRDSRIKAVALTGSEKAGSAVASVAGSEIKKTVLELGGSDPFIIMRDADIKKAVTVAVSARMQSNAGQSCIAAKRFIVHTDIIEQFSQLLAEAVSKLKVGDPLSEETTVGPLVNAQMVFDMERQISESVAKGARILIGGKRPDIAGHFFLPTILANVSKGMPVYDEEVFGPVLPIISFSDEAEAIHIANDSAYGLGATVFCGDIEAGKRIARQIDSGSVFINSQVRSDPRLPFGGIKRSGYGRELSKEGIKEFVNVKTISVA